jgi:hypothetical protein
MHYAAKNGLTEHFVQHFGDGRAHTLALSSSENNALSALLGFACQTIHLKE